MGSRVASHLRCEGLMSAPTGGTRFGLLALAIASAQVRRVGATQEGGDFVGGQLAPGDAASRIDQIRQLEAPEPHRSVVGAADDPAAVLREVERKHASFVAFEDHWRRTGIGWIPEAGGLVFASRRQPA